VFTCFSFDNFLKSCQSLNTTPPQYFAYFLPFIYRKMKKIYILSYLITLNFILTAQPKPTDIFREYTWATPKPSANGQELFLRVCGDGFYDDAVRKGEHLFPKGYVNDGWFTLPQDIDLKDAVRAEILVERMLVWWQNAAWYGNSIPRDYGFGEV
jgi:hypothetical protein